MVFILSVLDLKIPFLDKFGPKIQNGEFELKIDTKTNLNMKNSMMMFIFPVLDWKYPFFGNLFNISKFFVEAVI